jgi:cytochrome c2
VKAVGPAILAVSSVAAACCLTAANQARADMEIGEGIFKRYCSVCHSLEPGRNKFGPSLSGVVGRKAASIEGYDYSEAFRKLSVVWSAETLDVYLSGPSKFAPGTRMMFPGIANAEDRRSVVEYLSSVHE